MSYILITLGGDGDVYVENIKDIDKFLEEMTDEDPDMDVNDFQTSIPSAWSNVEAWGDKTRMLIKGNVVYPKAVEVATKYAIKESGGK